MPFKKKKHNYRAAVAFFLRLALDVWTLIIIFENHG